MCFVHISLGPYPDLEEEASILCLRTCYIGHICWPSDDQHTGYTLGQANKSRTFSSNIWRILLVKGASFMNLIYCYETNSIWKRITYTYRTHDVQLLYYSHVILSNYQGRVLNLKLKELEGIFRHNTVTSLYWEFIFLHMSGSSF